MRLPWKQFFAGDYLNDHQLSLCEPATRGIWMDALCHMMLSDSDALSGSPRQLARALRCTEADLHAAVQDLQTTGAGTVTERNGVITLACRRLQRERKDRANNAIRQERFRQSRQSNAPITSMSPLTIDSDSSSGCSGGEPEGRGAPPPTDDDPTPPAADPKQVADWTARALAVYAKHGPIPPTSPEAQRVRAHCAELIAYGKPPDKFALLLDWCANSRNPYRPKDAASMTDPAKWTKWQQSIEDEIERNNNAKGRRAHAIHA